LCLMNSMRIGRNCPFSSISIVRIIMKKTLLLLLFILHLAPSALAESVTKVGVILPLSGGWASWGQRIQDALELYKGEHPDENLEFIYQDEKTCDTKESLNGYKSIRRDETIKIVIVGCKNGTSVILPVAKHEGVLLLSAGFQELSHFQNKNQTLVNLALQIQDEAQSIGKEILRRNIKKLGFVRNTGTDDFVLGMKRVVPENIFVADEVVDPDFLDFNALDVKIQRAGVDAVFLSLDENQLLAFYKTAQERKRTQTIFSLYAIEGLAAANPKLKTAAIGTTYASPFSHSGRTKESQIFESKFIERYKESPTINSYFVIDGMRDLASARKSCLGKDTACIFHDLANGESRTGISGSYSYREDGSIQRNFEVRVME